MVARPRPTSNTSLEGCGRWEVSANESVDRVAEVVKTFADCRVFETLDEFRYMRAASGQALLALHLSVFGLTLTSPSQAATDAIKHLSLVLGEATDSTAIM